MTQPRHRAVVRTPRGLRYGWVPTPNVGARDVLVALDYVGVCGTDLQILNGRRPDTARILGHEGTGEVVGVGRGGPEQLRGCRVVFNPVNPADPSEILGHSFDGLYQETFLAPARLASDMLVPLDPGVPPSCGPLIEPLGTVVYGHELVRAVCRPDRVAVIGAGPIGLLNAIYARAAGAQTVFLVHSNAARLAWAVGAGIAEESEALMTTTDVRDRVRAATGGVGVDAAFVCTTRPGTMAGLRLALSLVRDGGCIDLVSGAADAASEAQADAEAAATAWDGSPAVDVNGIRRRNVCGVTKGAAHHAHVRGSSGQVWLTGHRGTARHHLGEAMRLVAGSPLSYARVVTHVLPMGEAVKAISSLAGGGPRVVNGKECVKLLIEVQRRPAGRSAGASSAGG